MRSALRRHIFEKCGHKNERQRASNLLSHMPSLEPYNLYITAMKIIHEFICFQKRTIRHAGLQFLRCRSLRSQIVKVGNGAARPVIIVLMTIGKSPIDMQMMVEYAHTIMWCLLFHISCIVGLSHLFTIKNYHQSSPYMEIQTVAKQPCHVFNHIHMYEVAISANPCFVFFFNIDVILISFISQM